MTLARQLAERIVSMRYEDFPSAAVHGCKVAVLDTVGVALAGSAEEAPRIVEDVLGLKSGEGPCLVFGGNRRVRPLDAALVNGTAAHALDFDNTAKNLGGHVSAVMVPALIAAGEAHGSRGRDVILAHAAGYELGARLGRCVNPHHSRKGWHPTATLGVFAVAAACSRLLGLTQGFFNVFDGAGNFDAARALEDWDEWEIVAPGASYKLYPCCYSTHAAVEAALKLARRHGPFDPRSVSRVDSWTPASGLAHTDRPAPDSDLAAKFSVQYCVARALLHGQVVLEHFERDAWRDPAVQALLARVLSPRAAAAACRGMDAFEDAGPMREFTRLLEPAVSGANPVRRGVEDSIT